MKFLCDSCKAKYQIDDVKVAGKSVRMKCRRCGHLIQVSASVTEGSVTQPSSSGHTPPPSDNNLKASARHNAPIAKPSRPPSAPSSPPSSLSPPRPITIPRPPAVPRPPSGLPPRASEPPAAKPRPPPQPVAKKAAPPTPPPSPAAAAFKKTVSDRSMRPTPRATPSEDWYVGVGGVPLGPVRLSVIRDKALAGAVDEDSLVWREGFDEWQPLKEFPELLDIVNEAQASRRRGSGTFTSPASSPSRALAVASTTAPSTRSTEALEPVKESVKEPPKVMYREELLSDGRFDTGAPKPAAAAAASDAAARVEPQPPAAVATTEARASAGAAPLDVLSDPFATKPLTPEPAKPSRDPIATPAPLPITHASPLETLEPHPRSRLRPGMRPAAYALIAMAAAFGGVSAFVLLSQKQLPQQPIAPIQNQALPTPSEATTAVPTPETTVAVVDTAAVQTTATPATVGGGPWPPRTGDKPAASTAPATSAAIDMSGFNNMGVSGPSATGPGDAAQNAALGQLSQGEINAVVNQNKPGVSRRCWQPVMNTGKASTARVNASIVISASGGVQSATANGAENDFPGLSSCIASRLQTWKFPPSSGSTPVNIPFIFAVQ